jgi:hypothetical protein
VGNKVRKTYDTARTPYQRVLESPLVSQKNKDRLHQIYTTLNPVTLHQRIDDNLEKLWRLPR